MKNFKIANDCDVVLPNSVLYNTKLFTKLFEDFVNDHCLLDIERDMLSICDSFLRSLVEVICYSDNVKCAISAGEKCKAFCCILDEVLSSIGGSLGEDEIIHLKLLLRKIQTGMACHILEKVSVESLEEVN